MSAPVVDAVRIAVPGFNERPMTFEDFLAACARDRIGVEIRPYHLDEQLRRGPEPRITLNAGLSGLYRTFVAFHALAHWVGHPGGQQFYLGSPGWLQRVELEASLVGLLALAPHPSGAPYPRLARAKVDAQQLELWIDYPRSQVNGRMRWKRRRTVLHRMGQMELRWDDAVMPLEGGAP